jgi:hypothetical protein
MEPRLIILHTVKPEESWQAVERRFIAEAISSGLQITNSTAGGEGLDYIQPEDRERYIKNLSASMKRLWSTPERKAEAKARSIKAWADPEVTERRISSMRAAAAREDVVRKVSASSRRAWSDPEAKARRVQAIKGYWATEAGRAKRQSLSADPAFLAAQSERLAARWCDDAHREKMMNTRWSPADREKQRIRLKDRSEKIKAAITPEVVARRNSAIKAAWARRKAAQATK